MQAIKNIIRKNLRKEGEPLNILCMPTHERYETHLAQTGNNFYAIQGENIKKWNTKYAKVPPNYFLMQSGVIPSWVDIDLVLSQNKFGQFELARQAAKKLNVPLVTLEHTLPTPNLPKSVYMHLSGMSGDVDVFISEYSIEQWGWNKYSTKVEVIRHGLDTNYFKPSSSKKERDDVVCSVVNDWINRDWCCLTRDTVIPLHNGEYKNISDIEENETLTSYSERKIYKKFEKIYDGKVYSLDFGYNNNISCTEEHPFVVINNNVLSFVEAKDLKNGDKIYVNIPKNKDEYVDILENTNYKYKQVKGKIICKGNTQTDGTERFIKISPDLFSFFGWYLAEGSITKNNIEFDLNEEEKDIADFLISFCKKNINVNGFIRKNSRGKSIRVIFTSKPLSKFLSSNFGSNSGNKKLPQIYNNVDTIKSLICGDGTISPIRIKFDSKSKNLVYSVFQFFSQFDIIGNISKYERTGFNVTTTLNTVSYTGDRVNKILNILSQSNEELLRKYEKFITIKNITIKNSQLTVYNFNVDNDHTYSTLYGLNHNCGFKLWQEITKWPNPDLPINVWGDTQGLSVSAKDTDSLIKEYQRSSIFLNTSLISPVPTVLLEAMSCGCAVVSTNNCMIPEFIVHGENGLLGNTAEELRSHVDLLRSDKKLRDKLGKNARKTIVNKFSVNRFADDWNKVFWRALNEN